MRPFKRSERVAHEIMKILSEVILYEVKDPRLTGITILRVDISDDLKYAKVFYESNNNDVEEGLYSARGFLRSSVAKELNIKFAPELEFIRVEDGWISKYL
ncbi:MAG TPA: 30S ribosome-binding factor RbfA [Candidatus Hydrothermia bacterium]|mgnify:CR=1 FL=1|nr:30S ribosome-binding factor RbfA [Candidatus Hydrothermae bacterium]MDD3648556.1 30S ribosome-binding factor RbfA [Candidatus Hydrothermia bacterium]HOK22584.1 30S ribosome-binding factor RbfA [Candidatus Hydrothermia bacterium]HOL23291.1 30S ribosome-binding factor RbfA [Candidatus Hydrothermia bacterium]HOP32886.1 30S ribosome-binding factor RbfA [Candidatus Hydrothermia bacterium]